MSFETKTNDGNNDECDGQTTDSLEIIDYSDDWMITVIFPMGPRKRQRKREGNCEERIAKKDEHETRIIRKLGK